jgi:hypothetical protein
MVSQGLIFALRKPRITLQAARVRYLYAATPVIFPQLCIALRQINKVHVLLDLTEKVYK